MPGPSNALGGGTYKPPPPPKPGKQTGEAFSANKSYYTKGFEPTKVPVPKLSALAEQALTMDDTEKDAFWGAAMNAGRAALTAARPMMQNFGARVARGAAMTGADIARGATSAMNAARPMANQAMGAVRGGVNRAMASPLAQKARTGMAVAGAGMTGVGIGNNMATNNAQGRSVYAEEDDQMAKIAADILSLPNLETNDALVTRLKLAQAGALPVRPRDLGAILFHAIR